MAKVHLITENDALHYKYSSICSLSASLDVKSVCLLLVNAWMMGHAFIYVHYIRVLNLLGYCSRRCTFIGSSSINGSVISARVPMWSIPCMSRMESAPENHTKNIINQVTNKNKQEHSPISPIY